MAINDRHVSAGCCTTGDLTPHPFYLVLISPCRRYEFLLAVAIAKRVGVDELL
jgi:hypothetical protein